MASLTQWTWVWASSGRWWRTGKPGMLKSMGSQRVRHDWVTELNWCILVVQSFLTLWSPMKYSPPGSSVHGVLQARILECQITNGIFHRSRTKNFTIHMETQKTLNSQSSLEKEEWNWRNQPSWLQTILQSYSHNDSMVLAQKQKYRPMEQDRKTRNNPMPMGILSLTKEARIYNGAKTASSIHGAGKTGQLYIKKWNRIFLNIIHKHKMN